MLPHRVVDSENIGRFINAKIDVRLEGNTLFVHYTYDKNVKAIFMTTWSFMQQFDFFKGQNLFNDSATRQFSSSDTTMYFMQVE